MRRKHFALGSIVLAAAGVVLALAVWAVGSRSSGQLDGPGPAARTATSASVPASAQVASSQARRQGEPHAVAAQHTVSPAAKPVRQAPVLPRGAGADAIAELKRLAQTGSLPAMRRLVRIYSACPYAQMKMFQPSDLMDKILDKYGHDPVFKALDQKQLAARQREMFDEMRQSCADFPAKDVKQARAGYWYWLQRAADAGDTASMINYANNVIRSWPSVEGDEPNRGQSPLAHIEDIRRYRERAIGYLQTARARGEPMALMSLSQQYATGGLFQIDLVKSCAYVLAFRSTSAMQSGMNRKRSWFLLAQLQAELGPDGMAQARTLARQIESGFVEAIGTTP